MAVPRPSRAVLLLAAGALLNLLPILVSPYLPFSDLPGHVAHAGILLHWHDPGAHLPSYFQRDVRLLPSTALYGILWLLGHAMSLAAATRLFIAVACVVGLPLAAALFYRALGRDPLLAACVLPLAYHRCLWFGFVPFSAGLTLLFLTLALIAGERRRLHHYLLAAAAAFATALMHFFAAGMLLLFAPLVALSAARPLRRLAATALALAPTAAFLYRWAHGAGHARFGLRHYLRLPPDLPDATRSFYDWTVNAYRGRFDDVIFGLLVVTLALLVVWGRRGATERGRRRVGLWLFLVALAAYLSLPYTMKQPYWWAINVRFVVPLWVFAFAAAGVRRPLPLALVAPALVAAALQAGYLTRDFGGWFARTEMAGLDELLDRIPPGQRVLTLAPAFDRERDYDNSPFGYVGAYYVARRGGLAYPMLQARLDNMWTATGSFPPAPAWGHVDGFRYPQRRLELLPGQGRPARAGVRAAARRDRRRAPSGGLARAVEPLREPPAVASQLTVIQRESWTSPGRAGAIHASARGRSFLCNAHQQILHRTTIALAWGP